MNPVIMRVLYRIAEKANSVIIPADTGRLKGNGLDENNIRFATVINVVVSMTDPIIDVISRLIYFTLIILADFNKFFALA